MATAQGASEQPPSQAPYRLDGEKPSAKALNRASTQNSELVTRIGWPKGRWAARYETSAEARGYAGRVVRKSYAQATPGERKLKGSLVKEGSTGNAGERLSGLNGDGGSVGSGSQAGTGCP